MANATRKQKQRDQLVAMFGVHCYLCGRVMVHPRTHPLPVGRGDMRATFDHVKPIARGGPDRIHNKRLAHAVCNADKGDWTFTELLLGFKLN